MKKMLTLCALLFCATSHAQNFEGIIKWTIAMEITDPETKAKMEEASKKMADPSTQAKMREMQTKMNDPEFKKMMEANPQMKTQMEAAMKMMQGVGVQSMLPKAYEVHIKNENMLTKIEGGIGGQQELLFLKEKDKSYSINHDAKTFSVLSSPPKKSAEETESKVTKTTETMKILNYNCVKYVVESEINGKPFKHIVWATNEVKNFDFKSLSKHRYQRNQAFSFEKIDGLPLMMVIYSKEGKMTMEAVSLKEQTLPAASFVVPSGYKEVPPAFGF